MLDSNYIGIFYSNEKNYAKKDMENWFRPERKFPEVKDEALGNNIIYSSVRELLHLYHFDDENYGTAKWNPFKEIINPGDTVLLKPNFVMDYNRNPNAGTDCLYTQPDVVVPVLDYVIKALGGTGNIVLGDAPMQECDFENLINISGYREIVDYYSKLGIAISLVDFRGLITQKKGIVRHQIIKPSSKGTVIDLEDESEFAQYDLKHIKNLRITNYSPERLQEHHHQGKHEYYISEYLLNADVVINLPKPKTHRKAGYTAAMKNMVGINVRKEYLPHHTIGSITEGGDEYSNKSLLRKINNRLFDIKNTFEGQEKYKRATIMMLVAGVIKLFSNKLYKNEDEGSWYGNETISKTIVDLNKILLYADKNGVMKDRPQRKNLIIADLIIAGEKEGPVMPSPKELGVLAIGTNNYNFDVAIGTMMGADISRVSQIKDAKQSMSKNYTICAKGNDVRIISNCDEISDMSVADIKDKYKWHFEPTSGWKEVFDTSYRNLD